MLDFQVPVIAVFTKYDQFKRDIKMKLEDEGRDPDMNLNVEVESIFNKHYLARLDGPPPFICLESEDHGIAQLMNVYCINIRPADMQKHEKKCAGLIEMTANALSGSAVSLMLVAVQRNDLELSVRQAIRW